MTDKSEDYYAGLREGVKIARRVTISELQPLTPEQKRKLGKWSESATALGLKAPN